MEPCEMPRVKLGAQGLEVSKVGFGCMGLSGIYNPPVPHEDGVALVKAAFGAGVTFFDTADAYGPHTNEVLLGKALKQLPREKVQVATKCGIVGFKLNNICIKGTPEYVRECCEGSLARLDVEYIDLYYLHRIDQSVPIEETMSELKELVQEGKVKYIGMSEASVDTIRRAHAVHPLTAVQIEWSLWARDIEEAIVPLCRELGIGIVSYSPLGRGIFCWKSSCGEPTTKQFAGTNTLTMNTSDSLQLPSTIIVQEICSYSWDYLVPFQSVDPRYTGENLEKNKVLYELLLNLSKKHNCSPSQLTLSWVLHQGDNVVPIPGTTKLKNMRSNIFSVRIKLSKDDLKEISDAVPASEVAGPRVYPALERYSWRYANTPLQK